MIKKISDNSYFAGFTLAGKPIWRADKSEARDAYKSWLRRHPQSNIRRCYKILSYMPSLKGNIKLLKS